LILRLVDSIRNGLDTLRIFSIDSEAVFTNRFFFRIEYLVLLKLNISDNDDFAVLWNLYAIDIAAIIANKIANVYPGFSLSYNLFLIL
jgi:hypothetical protein